MRFAKTTVIGGVIFLIPIIVCIAVIGKAFELTGKLAEPLAAKLPVENIADVAVVHLLAAAILILICFGAGLVARTVAARRMVTALETSFLDKIPAYSLLKTKTASMLSPDDVRDVKPVVARFDDCWQIAFEIERMAEEDKVVLFMPGAPDPWSGSICVMDSGRVTPLDANITLAVKLAKSLGKGSLDVLQSKLSAPPSTS